MKPLHVGPLSPLTSTQDFAEAFRFLGFNHATGEILSHGRKAAFALAGADLREPDQPIEILDAGIAGKNLWEHQTPLEVARLVIEGLETPPERNSAPYSHETSRFLN